jgi:hypothetical protein
MAYINDNSMGQQSMGKATPMKALSFRKVPFESSRMRIFAQYDYS